MKPREIAERLIALGEMSFNDPPAKMALFSWHGSIYFGQTQQPYQDQPDIVFVSKTNRPLPTEVIDEIKRRRPKVPNYEIAFEVDFEGNYHLLRSVRNALMVMTPEQTAYALTHPLPVLDQVGNLIPGPTPHLYPPTNPQAH
jgi:hypothetical protein